MIDVSDDQLTDYILNIIISHDIDYTSNKNGIFINLSVLDDEVLDYIYNLIITHDITNNMYVSTGTAIMDDSNIKKEVVSGSKDKDEIHMKPIDVAFLSLSRQSLTI